MLKAGFGKVCISPPIGAPLAGFAARHDVSQGIHDDLFARALVLGNEQAAVAIVSVDVLALPSEFVNRVRTAIQQETSLDPNSVMIASTHTHAGPVTIRTFFNPDETVDREYMNRLADNLVAAVSAAWRERFPARLGIGAGKVEGVGVNRRSPNQRPIDEQVGIIKVADIDGTLRAVCINYACHPTVLGPDNLLVTGDFPAFAVQQLEQRIGEGAFAMFLNGTQGNISMGHSSELSAIGVITPGRTFERASELGELLANATFTSLDSIETTSDPKLSVARVPLNLPLKSYPPIAKTEEWLRDTEEQVARLSNNDGGDNEQFRRAKSEHLYASITNFYAKETSALADGLLRLELQGMRLNDSMFVAIPAEVFVEIGLRLKQIAPQQTFIVGIANGYIGYLPTAAAHEDGGYEVVSAKCRPESEEILISAILNLEKELFDIRSSTKKQEVTAFSSDDR